MHVLAAFCIAFFISLAPAVASDVEDFVKACNGATNLGEDVCRCTGENAQKDLSADGFDFLVASLAKDDATTSTLRGRLGMQDLMQASMYMTKGPARCAGAGAQAD